MSEVKERKGYSERINDPAFEEYLRNTGKWSVYFSLILAFITIVGFFIYGETSSDMDNPEALYIGLGIGGMFVVIALFTIAGRKRSKTWDGTVTDKKTEMKRRKIHTTRDDYYWKEYMLYTVLIRSDKGRMHKITDEDDDTQYNYYKIGDRVRHHGRLNSFEKYDKTGDNIVFCNACAALNDIEDEYCHRCKCPLLK
jgi:hypothetical protein